MARGTATAASQKADVAVPPQRLLSQSITTACRLLTTKTDGLCLIPAWLDQARRLRLRLVTKKRDRADDHVSDSSRTSAPRSSAQVRTACVRAVHRRGAAS